MKDFNLELAKKGYPVCIAGGRDVRILTFNRRDENYPIVGLLMRDFGDEVVTYTDTGKFSINQDGHPYDLKMKPIKYEGWINIYRDTVYNSREEALNNKIDNTYINTVKVEWEE